MVAYSFKKRFGQPILDRTKTHTIRAYRSGKSRHARPGQTLQLYTGQRTKNCRLLGFAECLDVLDVRIELQAGIVSLPDSGMRSYSGNRLDTFAALDGFADWDDLVAFWTAEHPNQNIFEGALIEWGESFVPAEER